MIREEVLSLLRSGEAAKAAELLCRHLDARPRDASAWFLLGAARDSLGDPQGASEAFSRSLALDDTRPESHLAQVSLLRRMRKQEEALAAARTAAAQFPTNARACFALAVCHEDAQDAQAALAAYDRAIALDPSVEDAHHHKGALLSRLQRFADASEVHRRQISMFPDSIRGLHALADVQLALGEDLPALNSLALAETLDSRHASTLARKGVVLAALGRFADANLAIQRARNLDHTGVARYVEHACPGADPSLMLSPENIFLARRWLELGQCDWRNWDAFVNTMRSVAQMPSCAIEPAVAFMSRLCPLSGRERKSINRHVARYVEAKVSVLPQLPTPRGTRVRVGLLSPDFREHLNAYLLLPLGDLLDRKQFELVAFSTVPDDGSAIRSHVRAACDNFVDLHDLSDRDAAQRIRAHEIDILLDVGGHTTGARFGIVAHRPARVHVNYLGYSCTLASPCVDYAIVDRVAAAERDEWSEKLVFLPDTHFLYDYRQPAPNGDLTRREYGLPEDAFVFCAFHRSEKITPDVFALWMRIMSRVPRSILWFRALSPKTCENLRIESRKHGIDPSRLAFAPFEPSHSSRYLLRHRLGDLMLDTLHHNAMTSACDAMAAGLPMLTAPGDTFTARTGASLVRAAGLPELVANNLEDYVERATSLAQSPDTLRLYKHHLLRRETTTPLFATNDRVRHLEAAFYAMYEAVKRGDPPADLFF